MPEHQVIIIAGPNASGKTALAVAMAKKYGAEIISADSRQCYRELNIGVARPSEDELREVPHHFIASHSILDEVNAAGFAAYAEEKARELFTRSDKVVMVGGTGLYIKAFTHGLDEIPAIDPVIRQSITDNYTTRGMSWLQNEVKEKDPAFFSSGEMMNPQRMMRALEVVTGTGRSILSFRTGAAKDLPWLVTPIALDVPREYLIRNIDQRVERMMKAGLVDEVKQLLPFRDRNALQTVGYAEIFEYLDGKETLSGAVEKIRIHTRQYAKRQMTWFRKEKQFHWFPPSDVEGISRFIEGAG